MKIYNKKDFFKLKLPLVFSYYNEGGFISGLYECFEFMKNEKDEIIDYGVVNLLLSETIDKESPSEYLDWVNLERIESGKEFYLDLNSGERDGMYQEDEKFLVYDGQDILNLVSKLQEVYIQRYTNN